MAPLWSGVHVLAAKAALRPANNQLKRRMLEQTQPDNCSQPRWLAVADEDLSTLFVPTIRQGNGCVLLHTHSHHYAWANNHPRALLERRRCFLVSRPLKVTNSTTNAPDWTTIGNGKAIPSLLDNLPMVQHWALCVVPADPVDTDTTDTTDADASYIDNADIYVDFDPSAEGARSWFQKAAYFELGARSAGQSGCSSFMSESHSLVEYPHIWHESSVRAISRVQEIGWTLKRDDWLAGRSEHLRALIHRDIGPPFPPPSSLLARGPPLFLSPGQCKLTHEAAADRELLDQWGTYRPLLWNCQEFAVFMAQMAINTEESARTLRQLQRKRWESLLKLGERKYKGMGIALVLSSFVPVLSSFFFFWFGAQGSFVSDAIKGGDIFIKTLELAGRYIELHQLLPIWSLVGRRAT